jgi:hypothetical protein
VKQMDSIGLGCAALFGCTVLLACSSGTTGVQQASGVSGATSTSGTAGASSGGTTSASGSTSGTTSGSSVSGSAGTSGTTSTSGSSGSSGGQAGAGASTGGPGGSGTPMDAGGDTGQAASGTQLGATDSGGDSGFPPITECMKPSVDRLEDWTTSGPVEGTTIPPTGNLLVMEGAGYVAKVQFLNVEWHVCPVYLGNQFNANANLSASSGFLLTYSSTSDMYVQARPTSHWSGGDQWATLIPSTGGVKKSQFFSFDAAKWKSVFGTPTWTLADTLKEVLGFVFVGQTPNTITFYGLRFDGYTPPCR